MIEDICSAMHTLKKESSNTTIMSAIIAAIIHYFKKDREQIIKNFKKKLIKMKKINAKM